MGQLWLRKGTIGELKSGRNTYTAELRGMTQALQQEVGRLYTPSCNVDLGDNKCRVNMNNFRFTGSVTSTIDQHSWIDTSLIQTNTTKSSSIQNIGAGSTTYIQSNNHGFSDGQQITFSGLKGSMSQFNGITTIVGYVNTNNFVVSINSTDFLYIVPGSNPLIIQNTSYSNNFVATFDGTNWNTNGGTYIGGGIISLSSPSEYFQGGLVVWTSGNNKGLSMEIKNYYPNYIFLNQKMILTINVGDTYIISAGCDKTILSCQSRFNNIKNFRGFNLIPGNDKLMGGT